MTQYLLQAAIKLGCQCDAIAVGIETEGHRQRYTGIADAQAGGDGQRRQHVRGIEQAVNQLVADIRPGIFAHQFDLKAFPLGKTAFFCRDGNRRIDQGNEADPDVARHRRLI